MNISDLNKERAFRLLREFLFPLRTLIVTMGKGSISQAIVSLHEVNDQHQNGFPVLEEILELQCTDINPRFSTANMIIRRLEKIEFISFEISLNKLKEYAEYKFCVNFSPEGYSVTKLNKTYPYNDLPSKEDIEFLVSEFKSVLTTFNERCKWIL